MKTFFTSQTLRRLFTIFCTLFLLNSNFLHAQHVPDKKFAAAIADVSNCPACITLNGDGTGELTASAATFPGPLTVVGQNIVFLTGIEGFTALKELNCGLNKIQILPDLPNSLLTLDCYNNQLSSLPALSNNLQFLNASNNMLTSLPVLPLGLIELSVHGNNLSSLPALPSSLTNLSVFGNQKLICLPILPDGLKYLNSQFTGITCLPNLPASLIQSSINNVCSPNSPCALITTGTTCDPALAGPFPPGCGFSPAPGMPPIPCYSNLTYVPKPLPPTIINPDCNTLMSTTANTYQWYLNGNIIPNGTIQTIKITASGTYKVVVTNVYGCENFVERSIEYFPPFDPDFTVVQPTCTKPTGTITENLSDGGFSIDGGMTSVRTNVFDNLPIGDYIVVTVSAKGCSSNPKKVTISAPSFLNATPKVVQPTCDVRTGTITITDPVSMFVTYSFDNGAFTSNNSMSGLAIGTHTVQVVDMYSVNCYNPLTVVIDPVPYKKNYVYLDANTCDKSKAGTQQTETKTNDANCTITCNVTTFHYVGTPCTITQMGPMLMASPGKKYQWYINEILIPGATQQMYFPTTYGSYQVDVTNDYDCVCTSDYFQVNTDYDNNCPQIHKNFGAKCDDGNANTINDKVRNDCTCRGDLFSPNMTAKCPDNMILMTTSPYGTVVNWDYKFTTNCQSGMENWVDVKQTSGYWSGYPFPPDSKNFIEYVASDLCGNKTSCSFYITLTPYYGTAVVKSNLQKQNPSIHIPVVVESIFPNPTDDEIHLKVSSLKQQETRFEIFNGLGSSVISENKILEKGENELVFDINSLQSGVYYIVPQTTMGHNVPTKFVKF